MSDRDHPLAHKVDALLGKRQAVADDRNIPVLTELVDAPAWPPAEPSAPPAIVDDTAMEELAQDIFARVSRRIDAELSASLEARLSEQMQRHLALVVQEVLADMKQSIANEIGDAINAAIADRLRR